MSIRILVVDDHEMVRAGLCALLQKEAGMEVIGEAADGRTGVRLAAELLPDVIVMDVHMPELNGIEAARQTLAARSNVKVVGLTAASDEKATVAMLRAGALGFVRKDSAFEELATAIRAVVEGRIFLSPSVMGTYVRDYLRGDGPRERNVFNTLSPREREILQLISEGRSTKEAALKLDVSTKTIETHRRNIMEKLKIDNVAELTKYAIREGLTTA